MIWGKSGALIARTVVSRRAKHATRPKYITREEIDRF